MKIEKINCAVIGLGNAGFIYDLKSKDKKDIYTHSYAYKKITNTNLISVSDNDKKKLNRFKKFFKVKTYSSYKHMLKNNKIDIVSICTPDETHEKILIDLLDYKIKCIICEKPVLNRIKNINKIVKKYYEKKIPIYVNYFRDWDNKILSIKKKFKNIKSIEVKYHNGLIHNGSHYLSLLNKWFGHPIYFQDIQFIEKNKNWDNTLSFKIFYKNNNRIIPVKFRGYKIKKKIDIINLNLKNSSITIKDSKKIIYKLKNKKISKKTEFGYIIVKFISYCIKNSINNRQAYQKTNFKKSLDCLKLAININSKFK